MTGNTSVMRMQDEGFSIIELLVTVLISAMLLGNITSTLIASTNQHHDQTVKSKTDEQAQMLIDAISYELRMTGSGMPLGQEDFDILDVSLNSAPLPILTTATANYLQVRLDEIGTQATVVSPYTPSFTSRDIDVDDASAFEVGDTVYLSNLPIGDDDGLRSTITAITGNTIQIDNSYDAKAGISFDVGSVLHKVDTITFDSTPSGISRQRNADTAAVLLPRSSFVLTYFDDTGAVLTPPLTISQIRNDLIRIRLAVSVDSRVTLKDGTTYTAQPQQEIYLRNLHLSRP